MDAELSLNSKITVTGDVVKADIQDEVIILHPDSQMYYSLNPMGSRVWELLQNPIKGSEIVESIVEEFDVERTRCENDILSFLEMLYEKDLVQIHGGRSDPESP